MFYEGNVNRGELRFGDVLRGFVITYPVVDGPARDFEEDGYSYKIDISVPAFVAVVTPCCSIGRDDSICLSPLIELKGSFFKNPHFSEDMTRINRAVKEPRDRIPPQEWEAMTPEKQAAYELDGEAYANFEIFVYDEHEELPQYQCRGIDTRYRMIDFKRIHKVRCQNVRRSREVLASKYLQLTDQARSELRAKFAWYYGRPSAEELALGM